MHFAMKGATPHINSTLCTFFIFCLLCTSSGENAEPEPSIKRAGRVTQCSADNLMVYQAQTTPLPSGIPTYTVQITNMCVSGCSISNIHFRCGWFSSASPINPNQFRRLSFNDCLVNGGRPIRSGQIVSFLYANTYRFPMTVASVSCS